MSGTLSQVKQALQDIFHSCAVRANMVSGVIQRQRVFTAVSLAQTFVLSLLKNPLANAEDFSAMSCDCGTPVSKQAIEKRYSKRLVSFFQHLFELSAQLVVKSDRSLSELLDRFSEVILIDGTVITLPDSHADDFAGCGTGKNSRSALRLQTEFELKHGRLGVYLEQGKNPDGASDRQHVKRPKGSLRIADLGYFSLPAFQKLAEEGAYFLSRIQYTTVIYVDGKKQNVISWLSSQEKSIVDQKILLGKDAKLSCRLVAFRLPEEEANRARQKLNKSMKKRGRQPTKEASEACGWAFLVTNVSGETTTEDEEHDEADSEQTEHESERGASWPTPTLSVKEVIVLYRARWQIELLFKRWKSRGYVDEMTGKSDVKKMALMWARLCAMLIVHWLTVLSGFGSLHDLSFEKIMKQTQPLGLQLATALTMQNGNEEMYLDEVLRRFCQRVEKCCRRDKRRDIGTLELLNNPELLPWSLS